MTRIVCMEPMTVASIKRASDESSLSSVEDAWEAKILGLYGSLPRQNLTLADFENTAIGFGAYFQKYAAKYDINCSMM